MDFVDAISEVSNEVVSRMDDDANDTIKFIGIRHMQFVKKYIHLWMTVACQTLCHHEHHKMMDARLVGGRTMRSILGRQPPNIKCGDGPKDSVGLMEAGGGRVPSE